MFRGSETIFSDDFGGTIGKGKDGLLLLLKTKQNMCR